MVIPEGAKGRYLLLELVAGGCHPGIHEGGESEIAEGGRSACRRARRGRVLEGEQSEIRLRAGSYLLLNAPPLRKQTHLTHSVPLLRVRSPGPQGATRQRSQLGAAG